MQKQHTPGYFVAFFAPFQQEIPFWGGAHCFVHDHIGAVKTLMKLGPTAENSSRFFASPQPFYKVVHPLLKEQISPTGYSVLLHKLESMQNNHGENSEARQLAKENSIKLPVYPTTIKERTMNAAELKDLKSCYSVCYKKRNFVLSSQVS